MKNKVTAIILAAGQGKRMNSPVAKQFLTLCGKPVIFYSLKAFQKSSVDEIILVTGKDQMDYCREEIVGKNHFNKVVSIIEGGSERCDSVYRGLNSVDQTDYVLIHDGARPFITTELIEEIIGQVAEHQACIVGLPVKETIKEVDSQAYITGTPNRDRLWLAQTPQAFVYDAIKKAYDMFCVDSRKSLPVTDDAMVYESYMNSRVKMLIGDYNNIKITTPEDLIFAERIAEKILFENDKKKEQFSRD